MTSIAVIMAVHNRVEHTLEALRRLDLSCRVAGAGWNGFVTDDGSTDASAARVTQLHPNVSVLAGTGSLYWAAAMALADQAAEAASRYDYLLWLNNDTFLHEGAITEMLTCADRNRTAIVVGATASRSSGRTSYGGRARVSARNPRKFSLVEPSLSDRPVDAFNGNLVLIPASVRRQVGPIDGDYPHAYADEDYALRAAGAGFPIILAPGHLATCEPNQRPDLGSARGFIRRRRAALAQLSDVKNSPLPAQIRYMRRHGGFDWPFWAVAPYIRAAILGPRRST